MSLTAYLIAVVVIGQPAEAADVDCVTCHTQVAPGVVNDWKLSAHAESDIMCTDCHGEGHKSVEDVGKVRIPTPETCGECHEDQVEQYAEGKHALAWSSMKAMPTAHWQPIALMDGMKGCGGCHKLGLKTESEIKALKKQGAGFGVASCDACHTRHLFLAEEARQPQACRTCHMGFDHPQWEMYSSSKHGVRNALKQIGTLPESAAAPTCQECHLPDGTHANRTGWGFLAVRLPMPEDKQWAEDRTVILQALGVLDPAGNPTPRLELVKSARLASLTQEDWQGERDRMIKICNRCHSKNFAVAELAKGDDMIKQVDHVMAEGIRIVAGLYKKGKLTMPENYAYAFPDLLTFHNAPTVIEQKLFVMFLKHRMRAFQGMFHMNPDYAFWYGWSEMQRDLTEIKALAKELRH
ncbi:MAG: hypothetical protein JSU63_10500 [Phycisphaerales bacterium]|nr:MAG: hypothetical protein JSU63_10500 [Phycisphaerales bacterium]